MSVSQYGIMIDVNLINWLVQLLRSKKKVLCFAKDNKEPHKSAVIREMIYDIPIDQRQEWPFVLPK